MQDEALVKLCICTKVCEYILNSFRDVRHKSTSLMILKNDTVDTILKLKYSIKIQMLL